MASKRKIIGLARELRRRQTPAEEILWKELRNRQIHGVKFYRQHPIIYEDDRGILHFFIPDFYSAKQRIVIELDGKIHESQKNYDRESDIIIESKGLKVIRFKNEETRDLDRLIAKISSYFR